MPKPPRLSACAQCGGPLHGGRRYCSLACYGEAAHAAALARRPRCPRCNTPLGRWAKVYCSRDCASGAAHDAAEARYTTTMRGAALRAVREARGWTQRQVAQATYRGVSVISQYEAEQTPIPPDVVAWVESLSPVAESKAYPPTRGGLRQYMTRHRMRMIEVAAFIGVADTTVSAWVNGRRPVMPAVRAWLRAGAPPDWLWAPPGVPRRVCPLRRSEFPPTLKRTGGVPIAVRRWQRAAQARPERRKEKAS